jgi:type VI secretion system protein ImpA
MSEVVTKRLEMLLMPVAEAAPGGADLRADGGQQSPYFRLKDARTTARVNERAAEATGETTGIPVEWRTVSELGQTILTRHSKDLEVAAWLVEALVRLEGFAGLELGFRLLEGLVDRYWADLYSVDRADLAGKVSPLAGLNGIGREGTLVQPIRMVALIPGRPFGSLSLWHYQLALRDRDGEAATAFARDLAAAGAPALRQGERSVRAALKHFLSLTAMLEQICGEAAPPSSNTRNVLTEVADAYRALLGDAPAEPSPIVTEEAADESAVALSATAPTDAAASAVASSRDGGAEIRTREEGFAELLRIAAFFRKSEPHSPISYALETLVARGRMNLVDLLDELLPDPASRGQFLQIAGIAIKKSRPD